MVRWHFERLLKAALLGELDPEAKSIRQFFHHTLFAKDFLVCSFDFTVFFFPGSVIDPTWPLFFLVGSNHHLFVCFGGRMASFRLRRSLHCAVLQSVCFDVPMFQHDPLLVFQFTQVPGVSTKTQHV